MSFSFLQLLTKYARKIGVVFTLIIPMTIVTMLVLIGFEPEFPDLKTLVILGLWIFWVMNSSLFSLDAILLSRNFLRRIEKKAEAGFPIDSIAGFSNVQKSFQSINRSGIVIVFSSLSSLIIFLLTFLTNFGETETKALVQFIAIGLILITIGMVLVLKIPKEPAFKPGGLIGFYLPSSVPTILDNILSDSFYAYLDPATRLRYDDWTMMIGERLRDEFESESTFKNRVDRAKERILLLYYLNERMPNVFTLDVIKEEITEIIYEDRYDEFIKGGDSEISIKVIDKLIIYLKKYIPELFILVDQLIVELSDNLDEFINRPIFVKIAIPEETVGTKPFQVLVFILNNSPEYTNKKRPVEVVYLADREKFFPYKQETPMLLDESEQYDLEQGTKLPLYDKGDKDIVNILGDILQIADAYWLQIKPKGYGESIMTINIKEGDSVIMGKSQTISVKRDLMFYIKNYGSKLSFLGGFAAPVIKYLQNLLDF